MDSPAALLPLSFTIAPLQKALYNKYRKFNEQISRSIIYQQSGAGSARWFYNTNSNRIRSPTLVVHTLLCLLLFSTSC